MRNLATHQVLAKRIGRAATLMRNAEERAARSQERATQARDRWAELVTQADDLLVVPVKDIADWSGMRPQSVRKAVVRAYRQRAAAAAAAALALIPVPPVVRTVHHVGVWHLSDKVATRPGNPDQP